MTTDIWDRADNAVSPSSTIYGSVDLDAYECVLVKGQGKIPFDPAAHKDEDRRTSLTITISPLPSSRYSNASKRDYIAESRQWAGITLPSIKALGVATKSLQGKWAKVTLVPDGRKYTDKNGEEKESTTFKFLAIYQTEAECERAAAVQYGGAASGDVDAALPFESAPANGGNGGDNAERQTAAKFLPALVKQSGGDLDKLATLLANMPLLSKYFTVTSPEVMDLVVKNAAPVGK